MAKMSVEVFTQESLEDYWKKITGDGWDKAWAQAWAERREKILSQVLTPEDVTTQLGLRVEAIEDEIGLHVTVSPLNNVLQGEVVEDSRHGLLRKDVVSKYQTDGTCIKIDASSGRYVIVEFGTNLREPTNTILYVFPDGAT